MSETPQSLQASLASTNVSSTAKNLPESLEAVQPKTIADSILAKMNNPYFSVALGLGTGELTTNYAKLAPLLPPNLVNNVVKLYHAGYMPGSGIEHTAMTPIHDITDVQLSKILEETPLTEWQQPLSDEHKKSKINVYVQRDRMTPKQAAERVFEEDQNRLKYHAVNNYLEEKVLSALQIEKLQKLRDEFREKLFPNGKPPEASKEDHYTYLLNDLARGKGYDIGYNKSSKPHWELDPLQLAKERLDAEQTLSHHEASSKLGWPTVMDEQLPKFPKGFFGP